MVDSSGSGFEQSNCSILLTVDEDDDGHSHSQTLSPFLSPPSFSILHLPLLHFSFPFSHSQDPPPQIPLYTTLNFLLHGLIEVS